MTHLISPSGQKIKILDVINCVDLIDKTEVKIEVLDQEEFRTRFDFSAEKLSEYATTNEIFVTVFFWGALKLEEIPDFYKYPSNYVVLPCYLPTESLNEIAIDSIKNLLIKRLRAATSLARSFP